MQPQQPEQSNYDFIMNAGNQPKQSKLPGGNSMTMRIALVVGGLVLLIILAIVFNSILTSGSKASRETLLTIGQQQTELVRITEAAVGESTPPAKNAVMNILVTMQSDRSTYLDTLAANGASFKEDQLALLSDPATDERLTAAKAAANYNNTILDILEEQLNAYQVTLSQAYAQSKKEEVKENLNTNFQNADLLLKQLKASR